MWNLEGKLHKSSHLYIHTYVCAYGGTDRLIHLFIHSFFQKAQSLNVNVHDGSKTLLIIEGELKEMENSVSNSSYHCLI